MRLGELLISANVITRQQLEEALQAQLLLDGRLGTCLVELGYIDLDGLANALGYQYELPAALAKHFDRADLQLQRELSANLADRFMCVPLMRVGKRAVVVAFGGRPDRRVLAMIAEELAVDTDRVIAAVAPELRMRYALELVYQIPRPPRFLRAPGSPHALPRHVEVPGRVRPPTLDEPEPTLARVGTGERRRYLPTVDESPPPRPSETRISPADGLGVEAPGPLPVLTVIEKSKDREHLGRATTDAVAFLAPETEVSVLLALRGAVAVSITAIHRDGWELPPIAVPTDQPGLVSTALKTKALVRSGEAQLTELDRKLVAALGLERAELLVAPVITGPRIAALLVVASRSLPELGVIGEIVTAAAVGLERLMRESLE